MEAALDQPGAAWKPLTLRVTDRALSPGEQQGDLGLGTDILLSTQLPVRAADNATTDEIRKSQAYRKVAIRPHFTDPARDLAVAHDIHDAYQVNVGLGHGPLAVVAAAQEASLLIDDGPSRSPWPWTTGTGLGLLLTACALPKALRRRSRCEARFRRLTAVQRQRASVVLELEALEVTYLAIDEGQRPAGFSTAWEKVRTSSLELARTEQKVLAALWAHATGMTPQTAKKLERFESLVSRLADSADAVIGAGTVIVCGAAITAMVLSTFSTAIPDGKVSGEQQLRSLAFVPAAGMLDEEKSSAP